MRLLHKLTELLALAALSSAAHLTIFIPATPPLLLNPASLPPSTHATILSPDGSYKTSLLTRINTIQFSDLIPGSHLLSIFTRDYHFAQYRVDVLPTASSSDLQESTTRETIEVVQTFRGHEWGNKGPRAGSGNDTLIIAITPSSKKEFFQERSGFDVLGIFKNPMILMALFSGGLVFGMPYLMENMDEETKADFEQAQKSNPLAGGNAAEALQNFDIAGWLAGKSSAPANDDKSGKGSTKGKNSG